MPQPLGNLAVDDKIEIPIPLQYQDKFGVKMVWKIADKEHKDFPNHSATIITRDSIATICIDAKEPSNPNTNRALTGNNRYIFSNQLQWLNSSAGAGEWYSAKHIYDAPPTEANVTGYEYASWPGFLAMLPSKFVNLLLDTTYLVAKDGIDGDEYETFTAKVVNPSNVEVGLSGDPSEEGSRLALFTDDASRIISGDGVAGYWRLRSPDRITAPIGNGGRVKVVSNNGSGSYNWACSTGVGSRPITNISQDVLVSDTKNADGNYEIMILTVPIDAITPNGEFVDGSSPQTFSWKTAEWFSQTKVQIQYSRTGSEWIDLISLDTTAQEYQFPANSLPTGSFHWRIRVGNDDGFVDAWSEPLFVIVQAAPAPVTILSITNSARPAVAWEANDQIAFQLQVLQSTAILYDTGEVAGDTAGHTVTEYLFDGAYILRIRVKNSSVLWSDWADQNFEIETTKPNAPAVSVSAVPKGAVITATPDETATQMYLFRNGVPISKISGVYYDYSALGETTYFVRAIGVDDSFIDTAPVSVTVTVPCAVLAAVDDLQNTVDLKARRGEYPTHSGRRQIIGTARHYAGRAFPLYTFSEFTEEELSPVFSFPDPADWAKLETLIYRRQTVLYRDRRGDRYYGVITGVDYDRDRIARDFTLSITRVDYVERIDFDAPEV